jgi:hypothetical protein
VTEDTVRKEFEQLADDNQLHGIARITCGNYFMEGYDRGRSAMAKEAALECHRRQLSEARNEQEASSTRSQA